MPKGAVSGGKCSGSFAWYDRDSSLWRTWQRCLTGGLMKFLDRWPKAGMMQNGHALELPSLDSCTTEKDSILWPTTRAGMKTHGVCWKRVSSGDHRSNLEEYAAMKMGISQEMGPYMMNPLWCEVFMGYPKNHTDLGSKPSETQ